MTTPFVRFRCPECDARIKAPLQLAGQGRTCPNCSNSLVVPNQVPQDMGPVLVLIEGEEGCRLGVKYRRGA